MAPSKSGSPQPSTDPGRPSQRLEELERQAATWQDAYRELEQKTQLAGMVLESMRDAIYVVSAGDYRIIDCNHVFLERYGLQRDKVIGRTCYEVKRGRNNPCLLAQDQCPSLDTFISGQCSISVWEADGPDGRKTYCECSTHPVFDDHGRVTNIVHVDRDITGRKLAEERLRRANQEMSRSNAFLRNLINSSVDAIIASDMNGSILLFNQAAGEITGYGEQEALSRMKIWDIYQGDGAREIMRRLRSELYGGQGKLSDHQTEIVCKDGSAVPIMLSAAVVMDGGREVATVGFFYDLREKRRMEAELNQARLQLMQAEKMASIGKLAAGVAHQLNNPLAGITLFANILLEEYDLDEQAIDDIGRILDNADRSRDTVKELLQFARQTAQEIRPADINQALARTLFLLQNQSQFHNIEIIKNLDQGLPEVPVDIQQLNHVFMNIVLNAADAAGEYGEITVATSRSEDGRYLRIEITDSGPGIDPEVLPHLFEPFFTTKEQGKGTGLGLSVAYGIIKNHKGHITARNLPEGGAAFTVELPMTARG